MPGQDPGVPQTMRALRLLEVGHRPISYLCEKSSIISDDDSITKTIGFKTMSPCHIPKLASYSFAWPRHPFVTPTTKSIRAVMARSCPLRGLMNLPAQLSAWVPASPIFGRPVIASASSISGNPAEHVTAASGVPRNTGPSTLDIARTRP